MYHNFFIHSSVSGHLGCFYVLAIVNSAAVNIGVHVSFSILVSLGYMPRSGIARKLKQGICINLEGWNGEGDGREAPKGGDICISSVQSLSRVRLFATP